MLCSHIKKFIFLKTMKTAGTSAEIFFERHCVPPHIYEESHCTSEIVSDHGVIGYRGGEAGQSTYYNHMPAVMVRDRLGAEIWESYFKFCTIRNPYDKVVSMFWMQISDDERIFLADAPFAEVRRHFSEFIRKGDRLPLDQQVFMIDGEVVVDFFIRFEHFIDDIKAVCHRLDIETPLDRLGTYKTEYRVRSEPFQAYYDEYLDMIVRRYFSWEIRNFQYGL